MIEFDPTLVHDWLCRSARRFPDKVSLVCGQQRWTYKALDRRTSHLAAALLDAGVRRQDRVVVLLDNCPEAVISLYSILKAGGVFVILAGSIKGTKLRYILDNSEAEILITHTSKAKVVSDALSDGQMGCELIWVGPQGRIPEQLSRCSLSWDEIFSDFTGNVADSEKDSRLPRCVDVDLATLIYTSGSTGEPKGVMSTHHNMISAARSIIQYIGNVEDDIILDVLPLSFDYGLYQVIMAFMFGGTVVLEKSFLYIHPVLERIAQEQVTGFPIVPTIVAMLLKQQDLSKYDFSTLRYMTNTGAALPVEHIRRLRELFPQVTMISMFGLTECKRVCYLPPEELDSRPSSVGKAMPNCEVFVVDEDQNEVAPGQTGELIVRGSNVMQGYWKDPELTAKTYRNGRYPSERVLYSGDYFRKDDQGFLYFLGRKDDMIKSKGERISAKEVENNICGMEGVAEVAVLGLPDEILGQAIKAYIVSAPDVELTEKQVLKYCSANMETFMVPKYIEFIDNLPKTPNGKIDKKQLKSKEEVKYV
ncbi:MAG: AMP-dependent synthetase [Phycisphaerae bacterium SM1_79]|nr:MAG: AMP-dependent synthetase [Phycisphaerae bacterium SM1_79]